MRKLNLMKLIVLSMSLVTLFCANAFARGWVTDGFEWQYIGDSGEYETDTIKSSGNDKYYLDSTGNMVRDYLLENYQESVYYFDDSGKMVKNTWVAVDPAQVENTMENGPTVYLYYFGANGKAFKAKSNVIRKTIDGKKYLFNENGQMMSGWVNEQGARYNEFDTEEDPFVGYCYYAGDETDGVLREGWSSYMEGSVEDRYYLRDTLWFYFKPGDCKKYQSDDNNTLLRKKINGRTYAFDDNGVMAAGWDSDMLTDRENIESKNYYSEKENDIGRMHKKEWVFAIPSLSQDPEDHEAETERWFYSMGSGDIAKSIVKKINGDYFVFDHQGILKGGICVIEKGTNAYYDVIDLEKTDGFDFIMSRFYVSKGKDEQGREYYNADKEFRLFDDEKYILHYFEIDEGSKDYGKRKTGDITVAFADKDYTFKSRNSGEYEGYKDKKYYQAGLQLKADETLGLGLVFIGYSSTSEAFAPSRKPTYFYDEAGGEAIPDYAHEDVNHKNELGNPINTDYIVSLDPAFCAENEAYPVFAVVDKSGNKIKNSFTVRKDKSGNYWAIGSNAALCKIYEVPVKYMKSTGKWYFKSDYDDKGKTKNGWLVFSDFEADQTKGEYQTDIYGRSCWLSREHQGNYELRLTDAYTTNFRFVD